ncbi:MAG: hypothetical protein A2583_07540 [Bdellovibrionales bacterium RIFOXYD1_FULL_53_11]|nr:MAG: hypothetical protein A2583_07540 [Bdellovibrionales bacterium RIFOXYD1_FULL_53_11]
MDEKKGVSLLLVEDERNVGSTLVERFAAEGFDVAWSVSVASARKELAKKEFDAALVDVGLPDGNGFDLAGEIRKSSRKTALVFLTAYGTPEDRVHGLELGAEDYVVKPFHFKELLLRINNAIKRAGRMSASSPFEGIKIGKATVWFSKFEIYSEGSSHSLTHKECAVLRLLFEKRGNVVSREEILIEVWGDGEIPSSRTIDNFIVRIRRLVEENPENPQLIRSVRGVGYQLV